MEYSSGKVTGAGGYDESSPDQGSAIRNWFESMFSQHTFDNMLDALRGAFCAGIVLYAIGSACKFLLTRPFAVLKTATPGKFKVTKVDLIAFLGLYAFIWAVIFLTVNSQDHRIHAATAASANWLWVWALGVSVVSEYQIVDTSARLLTLCILVPIVRTGFLFIAPPAFVLSTLSFHGSNGKEKYGYLVVVLEVIALVAVFKLRTLVVYREIMRRERLPAVAN